MGVEVPFRRDVGATGVRIPSGAKLHSHATTKGEQVAAACSTNSTKSAKGEQTLVFLYDTPATSKTGQVLHLRLGNV